MYRLIGIILLATALASAPVSLPAQSLMAGRYFGQNGELTQSLSLFPDSVFFISVSDGLRGQSGRGTWDSTRDSLILTFKGMFNPELSDWELISAEPTDVPILRVKVVRLPSLKPFPGVQVVIHPQTALLGAVTGLNGVAEIDMTDVEDFTAVHIRSVGIVNLLIPADSLRGREVDLVARLAVKSREMTITAHGDPPEEIPPERWAFKIDRSPGESLRLTSPRLVLHFGDR